MNVRKQKEEKWEREIRDMERQLISEQIEKQNLEEANDQYTARIKFLEDENDTIQQGVMFKEE
jgi:hypothetical protein